MTHDLSTTLRSTRSWTGTLTTLPGYLLNLGLQGSSRIEGFPDDPASAADPEAYRKFLADNGVESFFKFEGYPGVTVEEIKKALRVRNAFSNMLDQMQ
jgi:hypothetical protein